MKKTCIIVGAGSFEDLAFLPGKDDLIIAADGGFKYLEKCKIEPHVLLGDFDSLKEVPEHEHLIRHSPVKDDTDMALSVAYAMEQGYTRFYLYGGLGGRLDHTLANLQLLTGLSRAGIEAYLIGEGTIITAITNEQISFQKSATGMISVFAAGDKAIGVCEEGLKYTLDHAVITCDRALGVSNEFIGSENRISVEHGTLTLLWNIQNGLPIMRRRISEDD